MRNGSFPKSCKIDNNLSHFWERSVIDNLLKSKRLLDDMFSISDVARIFECSSSTVRCRVRSGVLKRPIYNKHLGTGRGVPCWDKDYILRLKSEKEQLDNKFREEYFDVKSLANYLGTSVKAIASGSTTGTYPRPCLKRHFKGKGKVKSLWKKSKIKKLYSGSWLIRRDIFISTRELADLLKLKRGTFNWRVLNKQFPKPTKKGAFGGNFWEIETVRTWLTKHQLDRLPALEALLKSRQANAERTQPCI